MNNTIAIATRIFQNTIDISSDINKWAIFGNLLGTVPFTPIGTGPGQCFPLNFDSVPGQVYRNTLKEKNVSWRVGFAAVTQESVLAYEIGSKSELLDKRLAVNAAAFYYKYNNKQIRGSIGDPICNVFPQLRNVPKSETKGVELEVTAVRSMGCACPLRLSF